MAWAANRKWDSTFVQHHWSSKRLRPRFRNRNLPAARARPPPPMRAPHEMARSAATAALERVWRRSAAPSAARQPSARYHLGRRAEIMTGQRDVAGSLYESPDE